MRGHRDGPDRLSAVGSVAIHGLALALAWYTTTSRPQPFHFVTYKIDLVSPPPTVQAKEAAPAEKKLVVEHPEEPEPTPEKKETPAPVTEPEKKKAEPEKPKPKAETTPPKTAEKEKKATTTDKTTDTKKKESGEDIRVRMEGLRRDYPQYYNNIIVQMSRCFRWQKGGDWATVIQFVIQKDGSVTDIKVAQPSGNPVFDIQAMGAAECAGEGRLDSLPPDLPFDKLPVRFKINPSGGGD